MVLDTGIVGSKSILGILIHRPLFCAELMFVNQCLMRCAFAFQGILQKVFKDSLLQTSG
jgi:hypothetical protein